MTLLKLLYHFLYGELIYTLKQDNVIDVEKMMTLAKELRIKVTMNSNSPGFYVTVNGNRRKMDAVDLFIALFPELKQNEEKDEKRGDLH